MNQPASGRNGTNHSPHPTDIAVGKHIRFRRIELNLSQNDLGKGIGVAFQQIQKYENGTNRVTCSRLQAIADVLEVPVTYFFSKPASEGHAGHDLAALLSDAAAIDLLLAFAAITDKRQRAAAVHLVKTLSVAAAGQNPHPPRPANGASASISPGIPQPAPQAPGTHRSGGRR